MGFSEKCNVSFRVIYPSYVHTRPRAIRAIGAICESYAPKRITPTHYAYAPHVPYVPFAPYFLLCAIPIISNTEAPYAPCQILTGNQRVIKGTLTH